MKVFLYLQDLVYHAFAGGKVRRSYRRSVSKTELAIRNVFIAFRWKLFRLFSLITMGRMGGETYLGNNIIVDLNERRSNTGVRCRIALQKKIDGAYIQRYVFPSSFPEFFNITRAFDDSFVYLLSGVVISPKHGVMWFPDGLILQQSVIRTNFFYSFGGVAETLLPILEVNTDSPIGRTLRGHISAPHAKSWYNSFYWRLRCQNVFVL